MSKKDEDALKYVNGTNNLEGIVLSKEDLEKILEDVKSGKKDKSFLYAVLTELERRKEEVYEHGNSGRKL